MTHIADASTLSVQWWKSSASDTGQCVEFGLVGGDVAAIRDSKAPAGPALLASFEQVGALVDAVKRGDLA